MHADIWNMNMMVTISFLSWIAFEFESQIHKHHYPYHSFVKLSNIVNSHFGAVYGVDSVLHITTISNIYMQHKCSYSV